jgi:hypothetical protein
VGSTPENSIKMRLRNLMGLEDSSVSKKTHQEEAAALTSKKASLIYNNSIK